MLNFTTKHIVTDGLIRNNLFILRKHPLENEAVKMIYNFTQLDHFGAKCRFNFMSKFKFKCKFKSKIFDSSISTNLSSPFISHHQTYTRSTIYIILNYPGSLLLLLMSYLHTDVIECIFQHSVMCCLY